MSKKHRSEEREFVRRFEGSTVLQKLLADSGTIADVDDVVGAFREGLKVNAPPAVIIQALWDDEPKFVKATDAERLFSNLFGLHDLIASGAKLDLSVPVKTKRAKAEAPGRYEGAPDEGFVQGAWRYFDDHPKERERHQHAFDNRQDALISWLDQVSLSDDAFGLAVQLIADAFAIIELGGRTIARVDESRIPAAVVEGAVPAALAAWLDDSVFEAEEHETHPLSESDAAMVRSTVSRAVAALWASD